MSSSLSSCQQAVLRAIADTVIASLTPEEKLLVRKNPDDPAAAEAYMDLSAGQDDTTVALLTAMVEHKIQTNAPSLGRYLQLLSTSAGALFLTGRATPFHQLSREDREAVLLSWKESRFTALVWLFKNLTRLVALASCRNPNSPMMSAIGFPPTDPVRSQPNYKPVTERPPYSFVPPDQLRGASFDVVIVGSGAGGGVCAAKLAEAGYSVLVIEKSKYYHESEIELSESFAFQNFFEQGGDLGTEDNLMVVMAGSAFGGGTFVNMGVSLKTPYATRREWARQGLTHFMSPEFVHDLDTVFERIGASTKGVNHNIPNQMVIEGCRNLGYNVWDLPTNNGGLDHYCGYCYAGCRDGLKNGVANTWLRDAEAHGAKFIDKTKVTRVMVDDQGNATGVECRQVNGDRHEMFTVSARRVIASCGTLQSPGLLQRSGLTNQNIGKNLHCHAGVLMFGVFDKCVDAHLGSAMTSGTDYNGDLKDCSAHGYGGVLLEIPHMTPSFFSMGCPWRGAARYKNWMMHYRHTMCTYTLLHEKDSEGSVSYYDAGEEIKISFTLGPKDRQTLVNSMPRTADIYVAAGAREIHSTLFNIEPFVFEPDDEIRVDHPRYVAWKKQLWHYGIPNSHRLTTLASAHQMGTCRMGISPRNSVTKPTGETWEVKNLYVADGSLCPTAVGANPMVTIEAIALHVARNVIASLK
ncbi:hypothetical protein BX666DRAFT_2144740 [Dichotomocladium elegans]|nr:hypothetical protein BX666DRAFT_2144740 [Dichotomocladium elegans]